MLDNLQFSQIQRMVRALHPPQALAKANQNARAFFSQFNINLPAHLHYEIAINNHEIHYYVAIPVPKNQELVEDLLNNIIAANHGLGSVGTLVCVSSVSCPEETFSSLSTLSTGSTSSSGHGG